MPRFISCLSSPVGGGTAVAIYFMSKLLYLANALGQFFLLNFILGFEYKTYGLRVLESLLFKGVEWEQSKYFPRSTFCDVGVRYKGDNYNNYTIQCVLPVNLFHEKIFAILWFWYAMVAALTLIGIVFWLAQMSRPGRKRFILSYLDDCEVNNGRHKLRFEHFFSKYLSGDGVLMLRLVSKNSNCTLTSDLLNRLWQQYLLKYALMYDNMSSSSSSAGNSLGPNAPPSMSLDHQKHNPDSEVTSLLTRKSVQQ